MVRKSARLAFPATQLEFHTEHSQYKITNDSGNTVGVSVGQNSSVLSNAMVEFQTQNVIGDNIGSFSVIISGQHVRWDKVLNVNDIITIRIDPNEVESKQEVFNTNIFTGLVSEIAVIGQYGSNSLMFQVSGKSFAKAFTQYKIGLISQVELLISNMGWLWDINAELDPMSVESSSGSGKGGYLAVGSYSKSVVSKAKAVAKAIGGDLGINPKFVFGQIYQETGFKDNPLVKYNNLSGVTYIGQKGARQGAHQPDGSMYYAYFKNLGYYAGAYEATIKADLEGKKPKTAHEYASLLHKHGYYTGDEHLSVAQRIAAYANGIRAGMTLWDGVSGKGKVSGTGSGGGALGDDDDDDGKKSSTKGEVNSTAAQINKEKDTSEGVAFFGNTASTIEKNIINRFKRYMVYSYDDGKSKLWDFLDYSGMQSWTDYEYLFDSSQFTNASGSLWDLMQNALGAPFNEMYFDSMANGKSKLVVRRTPFNPEDWERLTKITIDSNDIIDYEVGKTDLQQYSVFVVNPATPTLMGISNGMLLSAYPQTNQQLIDKYGYAKYEVDDLYLSGRTNDNNGSGKPKKQDNSKGKSDSKAQKEKEKKEAKDKKQKPTIVPAPTPPSSSNPAPVIKSYAATYNATASVSGGGSGKSKNSKKNKSKKPKYDNTSGTYYDVKAVSKFLSSIGDNTIRLNKSKYAKILANSANNISDAQAYDIVNSYCANGYKMTQEIYDNILQTDTGGGLSNTGTKDASYKNMVDCIKRAGGDEAAFMSVAKSTLKNVSDEFLRQVWQARGADGKLTKTAYKQVYDVSRNAGGNIGEAAPTDLRVFTRMLYNWYADNFNFSSGTIIVSGNPDIRVGCILDVVDFHNKLEYNYPGMRFYIESVTHKFSFSEGYTTEIGVTRGMKMPVGNNDDPRFNNLWGTSVDYKGGYMGESPTSDLALAESIPDSDGTDGSGAFGGAQGNEIAVKAAKFGYTFRKDGNPKINGHRMKEVYSYGAGHGGSKNPLTHDLHQGTIALDCSSFTYWCFKHFGATIGGVTTSQLNDPKFKKVHVGQSSKNMKVGDLVFMENCGHVMFYIGNGKLMGWNGSGSWNSSGGCQIQTLATVKSWAHGIDGVVARFQ